MIHLFLNTNDGVSATKTIKDMTADEAESWMIKQIRQQCPAVRYQNLVWSEDDANLWFSFASDAWRNNPVVKEVSAGGKTFRFRGPMVISGRGEENAIVNLPWDYVAKQLRDGAQIEFRFKDDPIFVPSYEEWMLIDKETRDVIADGLWCWSRTHTKDGKVPRLWADADPATDPELVTIEYPIGSLRSNGGAVALININLLPEDVRTTLRGLPHFLCEVPLRTRSGEVIRLVKISDHFYALNPHDADNLLGTSTSLRPMHTSASTIKYGYEGSALRKELLGSLDTLCEIIRYNKRK